MGKPLVVSIGADAKAALNTLTSVQTELDDVGTHAKDAGRKMDQAFTGVADSSDNLASSSSKATGALGALSSGFELVGLDGYATSLQGAAMATDFFSGIGDGLNLVMESTAVKTAVAKVQTLGKAAADTVAAGAAKAMAAAQWLVNAAMSANPIGLVVIAIVALVAAFVLAYKKSETFRKIVQATFSAVQTAIMAVWNWVRNNFGQIFKFLTAPIVLAVNTIRTHKDTILNFFKTIPGKIGKFFSGLASVITAPFRTAFNLVADLWNGTVGKISFTVPSWVPGVGGKGFSFPQIPKLASGGIVTRPTLALIGEAGPEAVVPLGSRGFGNVYYVNNYEVNVSSLDPATAGPLTIRAIQDYEKKNGKGWRR